MEGAAARTWPVEDQQEPVPFPFPIAGDRPPAPGERPSHPAVHLRPPSCDLLLGEVRFQVTHIHVRDDERIRGGALPPGPATAAPAHALEVHAWWRYQAG